MRYKMGGGAVNKSESKYFNTSVRMDEAFLELLGRKEFEYITIKEICSASGVNRSTFYLHYETLNDLLIETAEYINNKFFSYFEHIDFHPSDIVVAPKESLNFITPEFLTPWLSFIKENKRLYGTILKRYDTLRLSESYAPIMKKVIHPILERFEISDDNKQYIMPFYLEGLNAIIKEWIRQDCKKDMDELMKIIMDCVVPK